MGKQRKDIKIKKPKVVVSTKITNPPDALYFASNGMMLKKITPLTKTKSVITTSIEGKTRVQLDGVNDFKIYLIADEILPQAKLVRIDNPSLIPNPEKYGFSPKNFGAKVSIGEHALGNNKSPYISTSTLQNGAKGFTGKKFYLDVEQILRSGGKIHATEEIIQDLERIKTRNPSQTIRINRLMQVIKTIEKETLVEGKIPAEAVKSQLSMNMTTGVRVVSLVGVGLTVYDLGKAANKSIDKKSSKPIIAESIRQAGGWGGAVAGGKIGSGAGALIGIETGPGAIVFAVVGGLVFGTAGYFGADWVADYIDKN